jgi:hypothetical protein
VARIYQKNITDTQKVQVADLAVAGGTRALVRFWVSVAVVIFASIVFFVVARRVMLSRYALALALVAAAAGITFLIVMSQSLRRIKLVSRQDVEGTRFVKRNLAQLDDRFAVFSDVHVGGHNIDHVVLGPTGVFGMNARFALVRGRDPQRADLEEITRATQQLIALAAELMPSNSLEIEPVICVIGEEKKKVRRNDAGVWIVPAEKMVSSLLKRSNREGAITQGVNETGAFSNDTLQSAAFEAVLARHWNLSPEKNYTEFLTPVAVSPAGPFA